MTWNGTVSFCIGVSSYRGVSSCNGGISSCNGRISSCNGGVSSCNGGVSSYNGVNSFSEENESWSSWIISARIFPCLLVLSGESPWLSTSLNSPYWLYSLSWIAFSSYAVSLISISISSSFSNWTDSSYSSDDSSGSKAWSYLRTCVSS